MRVLILVEGQTEHRFVQNMLVPHLAERGVYLASTIYTTKNVPGQPQAKGGLHKHSYEKLKRELRLLLSKSGTATITTMIDLYALPENFPGLKTQQLPAGTPYERVAHLERAFAADIDHGRFIPYLNLHEFEGLLFSAPEKIAAQFQPDKKADLQAIRAEFQTPEEINEGSETAPSKRILKLLPAYNKRLHGTLIANDIGLAAIRSQCPHFDQWVTTLENLNSEKLP